MRPLIGITGRQLALGMVANTSPWYRDQHLNTFFSAFAEHVARAGGIPVNLPFAASATGLVDRLDGLVVTGGQDVHPARWGGKVVVDPALDPRWGHDAHDAERDDYEAALIEAAVAANIPVLGVCRGHQLLNVVMGGTLIEHLEPEPDAILHATHDIPPAAGAANHVVEFVEGSWAYEVYGPRRVVNSWHHQAVDQPAQGIVVTGRASDGVVECIALEGRPVVGVQWHPEWSVEPDPVFDWLIARSSEVIARRSEKLKEGAAV